jgi:hypothetical protein
VQNVLVAETRVVLKLHKTSAGASSTGHFHYLKRWTGKGKPDGGGSQHSFGVWMAV